MLTLPSLRTLSLPKIKQAPEHIEKRIDEGKFRQPNKEVFVENKGYWFNELKKFDGIFENSWVQAIYSRRISPYNRLDERRIIAEMYWNNRFLDVDVYCENENGEKTNYRKFLTKGKINESKLEQLFETIEEKYEDILETRKESEELRENFNFNGVMDNILEREGTQFKTRKQLAEATEESKGRKLLERSVVSPYEKTLWSRKR